MYTPQVTENSKHFQKPDNDNNHNNNIEDVLDFAIHWDIIVDKP